MRAVLTHYYVAVAEKISLGWAKVGPLETVFQVWMMLILNTKKWTSPNFVARLSKFFRHPSGTPVGPFWNQKRLSETDPTFDSSRITAYHLIRSRLEYPTGVSTDLLINTKKWTSPNCVAEPFIWTKWKNASYEKNNETHLRLKEKGNQLDKSPKIRFFSRLFF